MWNKLQKGRVAARAVTTQQNEKEPYEEDEQFLLAEYKRALDGLKKTPCSRIEKLKRKIWQCCRNSRTIGFREFKASILTEDSLELL